MRKNKTLQSKLKIMLIKIVRKDSFLIKSTSQISPVIFSSRETSCTSCGSEAIFWRTAASPDAAFSRSCRAFTSSSVWKRQRGSVSNKSRERKYICETFRLLPVVLRWRLCCEGSCGFCSRRLHRHRPPGSSDSFVSQASSLLRSKQTNTHTLTTSLNYTAKPTNHKVQWTKA